MLLTFKRLYQQWVFRDALKPFLLKKELKFELQDDITTSEEKIALMVTGLTPKGWEL